MFYYRRYESTSWEESFFPAVSLDCQEILPLGETPGRVGEAPANPDPSQCEAPSSNIEMVGEAPASIPPPSQREAPASTAVREGEAPASTCVARGEAPASNRHAGGGADRPRHRKRGTKRGSQGKRRRNHHPGSERHLPHSLRQNIPGKSLFVIFIYQLTI